MDKRRKAYRGRIFYFKETAGLGNLSAEANDHFTYLEDGVLIVTDGKVEQVANFSDFNRQAADIDIIDYQGKLITPGFIDTHLHATQSAIVAAYGNKLHEWLENYVFPSESLYNDRNIAEFELGFFLDELLKNGTTTAVAYGPLFYDAADIFFEEISQRKLRFITGNILMDMSSPDSLRLSPQENYDNSQKLIAKWHNQGRIAYCISPRFALACSEEMMELCGALKKQHPDCYIQTHLDENLAEITQVAKVYPWSQNYLDVYNRFGLVTRKTILGHCIHTKDEELELIKATGAVIAWCPVSNNFLGSGLFDFARTLSYTDQISLGSDWGAGTSLSMFKVLDDAYRVAMLKSCPLSILTRWYLATLGAAKSLQLEKKIGSFEKGREADFIVIDFASSDYQKYRMEKAIDFLEQLFILSTLGSSDNIHATYIQGAISSSKPKDK